MRTFLAMILGIMLTLGASAQDNAEPWQSSITGQIEAFRSADGAAALEFASEAFRQRYDDPALFLRDIERLGYAPIVQSRSHSFGQSQDLGESRVVQIVNFVGSDGSLYESAYQMVEEADGWRVQGVIMRQAEGLST